MTTTSALNLERLQEDLGTEFIGRIIFFSRNADSTNEWAKELASEGAPEGTVAMAETQVKGHGRLGRRWISPLGGLWFSVIIRPRIGPNKTSQLAFVAGLAVAKVFRESYGLETETKWPNDVLVRGRKVCGIMGETSTTDGEVNFVVLGVGVNANFEIEHVLPKAIGQRATSLEKELGRKVRIEVLFKKLLRKLEATYVFYTKKGFAHVLDEWKKYAVFLGRGVEVIDRGNKIIGEAHDVSEDGALILKLRDGTLKHLFAEDVSLLMRTEKEKS